MIAMLLLLLDRDVRGWLVPKSRGCCLATQSELKAGPLAGQEVLHRSGSLLVALRG